MEPRAPSARDDREQGDDGHHRSTQHARLRTDNDDKGPECEARSDHSSDQPQPHERRDQQHHAHDDGRVAAGYRRQVRQSRHPHLLGELRRLSRLLTDSQSLNKGGSAHRCTLERRP